MRDRTVFALAVSILLTLWALTDRDPLLGAEIEWTEHTLDGAYFGAWYVDSADVDGDGDLDVLGAGYYADDISWWENRAGHGTIWAKRTVDASFDGAIAVAAGDVDGDGDVDVIGAAIFDDEITWWENAHGDGGVWVEHVIDRGFEGAHSVRAADLDGDGDLDVLGAALTAGDIAWWENTTGDGTAWVEHLIDDDTDNPRSIVAADVDGDGDLDALSAAWFSSDEIAWWENVNRDGTRWTKHSVDGGVNGARSVFAADIDRDGDVDVLGAAYDDAKISWWENVNADGTVWVEHAVGTEFRGAYFVYAADIDTDGDLDVVGSATRDDEVTWWENVAGGGIVWAEQTIGVGFDGATSVHAADVDGDGDVDVLGTAYLDHDLNWWENRTGCFSRLQVSPGGANGPIVRTLLRHQVATTVTTEISYQLRDEVGAIVTEWTDGPVTFEPGDEYRFEGPIPWAGELDPGSYRLGLSLRGMSGFAEVNEVFHVDERPVERKPRRLGVVVHEIPAGESARKGSP